MHPVESFPASMGSGAAVENAPAPAVAPAPISVSDDTKPTTSVVEALSETAAVIKPASPVMAAVLSPVTMAPAAINVVQHNPITHAVEVRPQVSDGVVKPSALGKAPEIANPEASRPHLAELASGPSDSIEDISEIFIGAQRLHRTITPLPPDMQALLDTIENDQIWADEAPLFLRDQG